MTATIADVRRAVGLQGLVVGSAVAAAVEFARGRYPSDRAQVYANE